MPDRRTYSSAVGNSHDAITDRQPYRLACHLVDDDLANRHTHDIVADHLSNWLAHHLVADHLTNWYANHLVADWLAYDHRTNYITTTYCGTNWGLL
jgi:hypothetical protein